jgi:hypothetical protein
MSTSSPLPAATPSPERRRHNEIEAPLVDSQHFRTAWRVRSRLDRLMSEKTLSVREWAIARAYRDLYDAAFRGEVQVIRLDGTGRGSGYRGDQLERSEGQLEALVRLRVIRTALGDVATDLVEACVVHDRAWGQTARTLGRDPHTVRRWTLIALRALAEAW